MLRACLIPLLLAVPLSLNAQPKPLRIAVADSWDMPIFQQTTGQAAQGIIADLAGDLGQQSGREIMLVLTPRKRVIPHLLSGEIDIACHLSPVWLGAQSTQVAWSVPLYSQSDVLVVAAQTDIAQPVPKGALIGAVLGYVYPAIEANFQSGRWLRDDARTQKQTLDKLFAGRYAYAVSNKLTLDWLNRQRPDAQKLRIKQELDHAPISCAVRPQSGLGQQLLKILSKLKNDGGLDRILQRYR